jgi:hypothetical protein
MKGVFIDDDQTLDYETNSLFRKIANAFFIPALNILPVSMRGLIKKTHKSAEEIIEHSTTHRAMEVLYDRGPRPPASRLQNFFLSIWLGTNNSKAIRNRLKLVKREIKKKIAQLVVENKDVKIVNIASGSARAVLESIDEMSLDNNFRLSAIFIDKNHEAILFSQQLAGTHKYRSSFQWVKDTAENFFRTTGRGMRFNIAETVGLMEYLTDEEVINIFSIIHNALDSGGIIIAANITNNIERRFISKIAGWKMIYRPADEFSSLLLAAGFALDKMQIYYEPQRIHCVIVAQK